MAKNDDKITMIGVVTEVLPNTTFKVKLENGISIICHMSGKMRKNFIRILLGDKLRVSISPYDLTRGIIEYREK